MLSRLSRHRRLQPDRRTLLAWVFPSRPLSMSKVSRSPFLMSSGSMPADYSALTCRNTSGPPASSPMKPKPRGRHSNIFKVPVDAADRRLDTGFRQALGVFDRDVLHAAVGVMDEPAAGRIVSRELFKRRKKLPGVTSPICR